MIPMVICYLNSSQLGLGILLSLSLIDLCLGSTGVVVVVVFATFKHGVKGISEIYSG